MIFALREEDNTIESDKRGRKTKEKLQETAAARRFERFDCMNVGEIET